MSEKNKIVNENKLFPVFLKLEDLRLLIVGGGAIGHEKLLAVLKNSPDTNVNLVAITISDEIKILAANSGNVKLIERPYTADDIEAVDIIIAAVGDLDLSQKIRNDAKQRGKLINAADKPSICDFYLGSIVQKGDLKIAISTNGKSPTMAKRLKETLDQAFPDETQEVLDNLFAIRENLRGDLKVKIKTLNYLTKGFLSANASPSQISKVKKTAFYSILIIALMLVGHLFFSIIPTKSIGNSIANAFSGLDGNFYLFIIIGFVAQMIDGALGMAYGVSVTTLLMSFGIPGITPAIASASMHASEIFTTGTSSLVYMRFRNVNMKLFRKLLWPGIIGAVLGAVLVSFISKENFAFLKPLVAIYTMILGALIILRALKVQLRSRKKIKRIFSVAFTGGLFDSIGGGGWGPIVTTSLVAGGRQLKYAIGSSHLAKFFVATISTITFFAILGLGHWQIIFGLVIGGMIAAPVSIYFSNKIPIKKGLIIVGSIVIMISLKTIIQFIISI